MRSVINFKCPTCGKETAEFLTDWHFSGLNDSIFNYTAQFLSCTACGLVYIANMTDNVLSRFYQDECCYFENDHFNINAHENIIKYEAYRKILINSKLMNTALTDVGCGRGGFLIWLQKNGWKANCNGVDFDSRSIPILKDVKNNNSNNKNQISFQKGTAFKMPFLDSSQSVLCYFHVLEHIRDIDSAVREARRVIKDSGYILIEVPDAERYHEFPVGTAFWFSIREHVNHFTGSALCKVLERNGFSVKQVIRQELPTPEFSYPSLMVLAQKWSQVELTEAPKVGDVGDFLLQSQRDLVKQAEKIWDLNRSLETLMFWGCSAELFSLLPILKIQNYAICDSSRIKQKSTYKGLPIQNPTKIPVVGKMIIAPYLHSEAIEKIAYELGWPKDSVFRLR